MSPQEKQMKISITIECSSQEEAAQVIRSLHTPNRSAPRKPDIDLDDPEAFREWVISRQEALMLSNQMLAEASGLSIQTIYGILKSRKVNMSTRRKIIAVLDEDAI
jgi:hypothetical protein